MDEGKEKIYKAIFIAIIVLVFVGAYFLLDSLIFGKEKIKTESKKIIKNYTSSEIINILERNGLSEFNLSETLDDVDDSHMFFDSNNNYEIIYSNFKNGTDAKNQFSSNLEIIKNKYSNLLELENMTEENYERYEAEDIKNYIILLRINSNYFQVETANTNKAKVKEIISKLE